MNIRLMREDDREDVLMMMKDFYASDAVIEKSPERVLQKDISDAVGPCPYLRGYVFEDGKRLAGYAMVASGYSTEFGGVCLWVEDLYVRKEDRHRGYGRAFLDFVFAQDAVRVKLEVELANKRAMAIYKKNGFHVSEYVLMTKERMGES